MGSFRIDAAGERLCRSGEGCQLVGASRAGGDLAAAPRELQRKLAADAGARAGDPDSLER
jgi:hypothetical protein